MKKIAENLYMYKGYEVIKENDNYIAIINVNNCKLPCKIVGTTQTNFKKIFNKFVTEHGGLKKD